MSGKDLQVIAKMWTDGLVTEFEYQRLVDIEDCAERVAATEELLYTKQNKISASLDDLNELSNPWKKEVVTNQPDVEDVIEENDVMAMDTQALLLIPVLNCLFRYCDIQDLKSCKKVCRKWRDVAELKLRKRAAATIVFSDTLSLLKFMAYYTNCLPCKPFTSFSFFYRVDYESDNKGDDYDIIENFDIDDLKLFYSKFGKIIKQLTIRFGSTPFYPSFDFGPFLRPSIITKLHLEADMYNQQELHHSLARFSSLKFLFATYYTLQIEGWEKKLSLLELTLEGVSFRKGNQKVHDLLMNEVFDLKNAEKIIAQSSDTELSIDMSIEISNPKEIKFLGVTCYNLEECAWQVEQFELEYVDFTEPHQAKIKKLHFHADELSQIDLALLSDCIEELVLEYSNCSYIVCSRPIIFPHLKKIRLSISRGSTPCTVDIFQNVIQHFSLCENLLKLELSGDCRPNLYTLTKLVVLDYEIEDIEKNILPWVNAEEVILRLQEFSFQEFDRVLDLILAKYDKVFLCICRRAHFLPKYGHLKGKYFAFENQMGVNITEEEFDSAALF